MLTYIIRRLLLLVPTLLGITLLVFSVMALAPGDIGGLNLDVTGDLQASAREEAREYYESRYGLDQSILVQYGRWLNRVSPVGFWTSAQIVYDDAQKEQAKAALAASDAVPSEREATALDAALALAAYQDVPAQQGAEQLAAVLKHPADYPALLAAIDSEPDIAADRQTVTLIQQLGDEEPERARVLLLDHFIGKARFQSRVLLARPALKWPDLGESLSRNRPVSDLIRETLPITILLNLLSIPIVYTIGILSGLIAARYRGQAFDVVSGVTFLGLWSVPTIWAGVMLIGLLANQQYIQLFPTAGLHDTLAGQWPFLPSWTAEGFHRGWLLDTLWHLALPVLCLSYGGFAFLSKLTRGSILENLNADFVRTARAKGVGEKEVLFRHVFRNSLLSLITVAAGIVPSLLAGAIVVETIFSIPGMGLLAVNAVQVRDRELVLAVTLIGGLIGLLSELIRDVCYAIADPRVSYE